jgi:hypothetical protein
MLSVQLDPSSPPRQTPRHRRSKTRRPTAKPLRRVSGSWDAVLSVVAGITMYAFLRSSTRELLDGKPYLTAAIALGSAVGIGWLVGSRWLTDHLNKDEYGEIVRTFDPDSKTTQRPYLFVAIMAFVLALGSILVMVTYENIPRQAVVICYSILFGLAIYAVLGSVSLGLITYRHTARASRVRALKERDERDGRLRKSKA